jgi:hypothetical protein
LTLDAGDQAQILGVGAAVLLALSASIFKTSSLRGDMNSKWSRRVALAVSALDEKLISGLEQLRDDVNDLLPAETFDPAEAIVDPGPLARRAERTVSFHRARIRMGGDLRHLRDVCPAFVAALTGLWLAALGLTASFGELVGWDWIRPLGLVVGAIMLVVLILALIAYGVLNHRLANAEILAGTGGKLELGDSE